MLCLLLSIAINVEGYVFFTPQLRRSTSELWLKEDSKAPSAGKGFGKTQPKQPKPLKKEDLEKIRTSQNTMATASFAEELFMQQQNSMTSTAKPAEASDTPNLDPVLSSSINEQIISSKMFQKKRTETVESIQQKLDKLREEEEMLAEDPSVGAVPEIVANRMIKRIAFFFGVPVFGGLFIFAAAVIASKKYDTVVPPAIIAYATQAPFVVGLVGISYAILSSSWDNVSYFTPEQ